MKNVQVGDIWRFREGSQYHDEFYLVYRIHKGFMHVWRLDTGDMIEDYSLETFAECLSDWKLISRLKHD